MPIGVHMTYAMRTVYLRSIPGTICFLTCGLQFGLCVVIVGWYFKVDVIVIIHLDALIELL